MLGGLGLAAVLVAISVLLNQRPGPLPGEQVIPDEGSARVPDGTALSFLHYPPSSGTHYESPAEWAVFTAPVADGHFVNNLARGGVVFLYECAGDCAAQAAQFETLRKTAQPDSRFNKVKILAAPYAGELPAPIVALAWGHQLNLNAFDEAVMLRWYKRFVNQGPNVGP